MNISNWLKRRITNNTRNVLRDDQPNKLGRWFKGELIKLIAIGVMIALFANGLIINVIAWLTDAAFNIFT